MPVSTGKGYFFHATQSLLSGMFPKPIIYWPNSVLQGVASLDDFKTLANETFDDAVSFSGLTSSNISIDAEHGVSLQYGVNNTGISSSGTTTPEEGYYSPSDFLNPLLSREGSNTRVNRVFSANVHQTPKSIHIELNYNYNGSSNYRAWFALVFANLTDRSTFVPVSFIRPSPVSGYKDQDGIYTNNFKTHLVEHTSTTGWNNLVADINIAKDFPEFASAENTEWELGYVCLSQYKGTSAVSSSPVYIKDLIVM